MRWLRRLLGLCVHEDELVQLIDHHEPGGQRIHTSCTHVVRCMRCGRITTKTINLN